MADLKQSTAATLTIGPVFDLATGLVYTGMAIGDFSISKNGTMAAMAAAATATSAGNGMYSIGLTTGNTDTAGRLVISCNKAGYQMAPWVFRVLSATMFDAIVTNGVTLPTDVQTIKGQAVTCAAPVTVPASIGTSTLSTNDLNSGRIG